MKFHVKKEIITAARQQLERENLSEEHTALRLERARSHCLRNLRYANGCIRNINGRASASYRSSMMSTARYLLDRFAESRAMMLACEARLQMMRP